MLVFNHLFLKLLFFEFADLFFFRIHITPGWRRDTGMIPLPIQIWIRIYGWRQDRLIDPIENWVYGLSNTTFKDLRMACSVSTIGFSQSVPSTQTLEFKEILDQWVQARTTYIDADYEQLSTEMTELLWLVMEMRSQMSGTCAPPYWPYDPS